MKAKTKTKTIGDLLKQEREQDNILDILFTNYRLSNVPVSVFENQFGKMSID